MAPHQQPPTPATREALEAFSQWLATPLAQEKEILFGFGSQRGPLGF